jgi:mannosyltransferase
MNPETPESEITRFTTPAPPQVRAAGVPGIHEAGPVSWVALAFLISLAIVLRVVRLNSDLWLDEVGTVVGYLRLPLHEIVRTYYSANQHLLYSVLGRISVQVFGESAWAARLPAVLFGIGGIPAMYYTARVIASEQEALLASAFLALSYHHVWFSQDARGYSAMVFFTLLGTGFLFRAVQRDQRRFWIGYTIAMTLGAVALLNTLFVALGYAAAFLGLWLEARLRKGTIQAPLGSMLISSIAIGVLSVLCHGLMLKPMIIFFRNTDRTALGWANLTEFIPVVMNGLVLGLGVLGLIGVSALMLSGWLSYWKQTPLVGATLILPGLINIMALAWLHVGAYPRSFLYVLPFALLIAVRGMARWSAWLRVPKLFPGLTVAVIAVTAAPLVRYYRYPKQDFTGALHYVEEHKAPVDRVAAIDLAGNCYRAYYAPGMIVPKSSGEIEALRPAGGRVWILYTLPRELSLRDPQMWSYVRSQLEPKAVLPGTLGGGDLYVARTR